MSIKAYHQLGHASVWNLDSFIDEHCGEGVILSPLHQARDKIKTLPEVVRRRALFDPQYYLPNSAKGKLASYAFFPEQLSNGFSTRDFPPLALDSAAQCVDFQLEHDFEGIVIPARFIDQMTPKYFDRQEEYTVVPFLKALQKAQTDKPTYLTLPITSAMLLDDDFRVQLLNWATSFPELNGVYVLVADDRNTKQIQSSELIYAYLSFAHELEVAGLSPVLGHLNTESVVLSAVDGATLTFGGYENTRIFSVDKFIESEEERRSPKPRMYLPGLLNWIQYEQAIRVRSEEPDLWAKLYTPTMHADLVMAAPADPHFSQPGLYKHSFVCMDAQLRSLGRLPILERLAAIREAIKDAIDLYATLEKAAFDFDRHGRGDHLQPWLDGLNRFYRQVLRPQAPTWKDA